MSQQSVEYEYGTRTLPDYLKLSAIGIYVFAGIAFIIGLYLDWRFGAPVWIPSFKIAQEPQPNSGMFILSFLLLFVGYVVSRAGGLIESRRTEEVDQTQEWTVEVGDTKSE